MYEKAGFIFVVIIILFVLMISVEPRLDTNLFSMIAVFLNVSYTKEVRESRGWKPLLHFSEEEAEGEH